MMGARLASKKRLEQIVVEEISAEASIDLS